MQLRLERETTPEVDGPSQAELEVHSKQIVGLIHHRRCSRAAEHRHAELRGQQGSGPVGAAQVEAHRRRHWQRVAGSSRKRHEQSAFQLGLELARGRDETAQLYPIARLELDGATIEQASRTGVEELEPLLAGRDGEASRQHAFRIPGEPDRGRLRTSAHSCR